MKSLREMTIDAFRALGLSPQEAELAAKAAPSINSGAGRDFDLLDLLTPENKYGSH